MWVQYKSFGRAHQTCRIIHIFSFQLCVVARQRKSVSVPFSNSLYPKAAVSLPLFFDEVRTLNRISMIIDRIDSSCLMQYLPVLPSTGRTTHKHYSSDIPRTSNAAGATRPVAIWYDAGTLKRIPRAPCDCSREITLPLFVPARMITQSLNHSNLHAFWFSKCFTTLRCTQSYGA